MKDRRAKSSTFVSLDEVGSLPEPRDSAIAFDSQNMINRLYALIQQLKPLDREVILLHLEGMDAACIGEISGISAGNVATKIHG
jgi:RNA polymerase sigma-70 factor, ECF subfamily